MSNTEQTQWNSFMRPRRLLEYEVFRLRLFVEGATAEDFEENVGISVELAKDILSSWEAAQVDEWDAEILKRFFFPDIYADRGLVDSRIQAAIRAGKLPERFTIEQGLQWLEAERIPMGMQGDWVRFNRVHLTIGENVLAFGRGAPSSTESGQGRQTSLRLVRNAEAPAAVAAVYEKNANGEWDSETLKRLVDDYGSKEAGVTRAEFASFINWTESRLKNLLAEARRRAGAAKKNQQQATPFTGLVEKMGSRRG